MYYNELIKETSDKLLTPLVILTLSRGEKMFYVRFRVSGGLFCMNLALKNYCDFDIHSVPTSYALQNEKIYFVVTH